MQNYFYKIETPKDIERTIIPAANTPKDIKNIDFL